MGIIERRAKADELIAEIYEIALQPERYDSFMALWDDHVSRAIAHLGDLHDADRDFHDQIINAEIESHFQRAFNILEKMGSAVHNGLPPQKYADAQPDVFVLFNQRGELIAMNDMARGIFRDLQDANGLKPYLFPQDYQALRECLLSISRLDSRERISVFRSTAAPGGNRHEALLLARAVQISPESQPLLALSGTNFSWTVSLEGVLKQAFGLSDTEIDVARLLCSGETINDVAATKGRSVHTIRSQVKSLLRKTCTSTQSDLVRIIVTLESYGSALQVKRNLRGAGLVSGRVVNVPLDNGRAMPVNLIGDEEGRPVLFIHGMLDGIAVTKNIAEKLTEAGLLLVAPIRPNFGDGYPSDEDMRAPEVFAEDLRVVMDALDLKRTIVIGHMAGSVFRFCRGNLFEQPNSRRHINFRRCADTESAATLHHVSTPAHHRIHRPFHTKNSACYFERWHLAD